MKYTIVVVFFFFALKGYSQNLVIQNVTLIDGNGGDPVGNQSIVVSEGKIESITDASRIRSPRGYDVIDGSGHFLLPGFVDTNVHASIYGGTSRPETIVKYADRSVDLVIEFVQLALKHGVTTIRDSFGALIPLTEVRDRITRGEVIGPRMMVAGNIVGWGGPFSVTWGLTKESEITPFQEKWNDFITQGSGEEWLDMTPNELRIAVNKYLDKGPDFIKYGGTSHFDGPVMLTFSPRAQKVIVDETHKRGLMAETHSTNMEGFLMSLQAGVDLVQHPEYSTRELTDEIVDLMVANKVICSMLSNTTTGAAWQRHLKRKENAQQAINVKNEAFPGGRVKSQAEKRREEEQLELYLDIARTNAKKLIEAGCITTIGTDNYQGAAPEFQRSAKLENQEPGIGSIIAIEGLVELGMTPGQAIVSGTKNGAIAAGMIDEIGTVEVGKIADLILLNENPLADIRNIRKLSVVIARGKVVDVSQLPEKPVFRKP